MDGSLSWRRLHHLVANLPPESASVRATNPDAWDRNDQLLAGILDLLAVANWQRVGKRNAPRPKPIPRPGVTTPTKKFGTSSRSIADMQRRLDRKRGGDHGSRARDRVHQPGPLSQGTR